MDLAEDDEASHISNCIKLHFGNLKWEEGQILGGQRAGCVCWLYKEPARCSCLVLASRGQKGKDENCSFTFSRRISGYCVSFYRGPVLWVLRTTLLSLQSQHGSFQLLLNLGLLSSSIITSCQTLVLHSLWKPENKPVFFSSLCSDWYNILYLIKVFLSQTLVDHSKLWKKIWTAYPLNRFTISERLGPIY